MVCSDGPIYNRLTLLRIDHELSRAELADRLDVNFQTIGYLERGDYNPSLDLAMRIAEFFSLPLESIFSREPFKPMSRELAARVAKVAS